jgi:hypothetical protein
MTSQPAANSPSQGRWISPDPLGRGAVKMTNPQTWNRYTYVNNNPLRLIDPMGTEDVVCGESDGGDCGGDGGGGGGGDDSSGGGGDNSGGDDNSGDPGQTCDADCQLQQAEQNLQHALNDPTCAQAVDGGTGAASATIVDNQATPGPESMPPDPTQFGSLATITVGDLGANAPAIMTWPGPVNSIMIVNSSTFTNIGVWPCPGGPECEPGDLIQIGIPGYGPLASQAILLGHDLGHAANNAGLSTSVVPDAGNLDTSLQNSATIGDACFPQGDFGGNQGPVDSGPTDVPAVAKPVKHHF